MEKSVGCCVECHQLRKWISDGGRTLAGHDILSVNLSYVSQGLLAKSKPNHKSLVRGVSSSSCLTVIPATQLTSFIPEPRFAISFAGLTRRG